MTSIWFFLSTLNYDARSTTSQIYSLIYCLLISLSPTIHLITYIIYSLFKGPVSASRYKGEWSRRKGENTKNIFRNRRLERRKKSQYRESEQIL